MKLRHVLTSLFALLLWHPPSPLSAQTWPDADTVAEAMTRANNFWIANNTAGSAVWNRGAYYTGNQRAGRVLGNRSYFNWATTWGNANQWKIGPEGAGSADAYACGQTYIDLYRLNPQAVYLADIKAKTDALVASAAVDGWSWIDAFYMQGPVLARLGNLTGETNYFQKLWLMFDDMKTRRGLFYAPNALWFRDGGYIYPAATTASGTNVFWSRGNGWVFAGLARVLEQMSTNSPHYQDYATLFQTMAPALKAVQSPDGFWRSSLFDTNQFPNPETSGTAFFTYGFAWGIRNGLLPAADYTNTVLRAWSGLTNLALNAAGRVGYVQSIGAQPAAATAANTTDYGVGAFLLAGSEIYLLATNAPALRPWAGADQSFTLSPPNNTVTLALDGSATEVYRGTPGTFTWWNGATPIATGTNASVSLPVGQHAISLKILGADNVLYSDTFTVTVVTQAPPVMPVAKLQFDFEDSGTNTTDSVSGVTLRLVSQVGTPVDLHGPPGSGVGGYGRSLNFNTVAMGGTGPMAYITNHPALAFGTLSNGFTLTLWIRPAQNLFTGAFPRFFSLGPNGLTDRGGANSLQLLSNGNLGFSSAVQSFVNTLQTSTTAFGTFNMPASQWSFLALTYDGTTLAFYGGSETNSVTLQSSATFAAGGLSLTNNGTLMLGNRLALDRGLAGQMDAVRFYQGAAAAADLELIRASAVAAPAMVPTRSGGNLTLTLNTRTNALYVLQTTPTLTPANWVSLQTNAGIGIVMTNVVTIQAGSTQQFFRYLIQ